MGKTGKYAYWECPKCGRRWLQELFAGGHQPIDRAWLAGETDKLFGAWDDLEAPNFQSHVIRGGNKENERLQKHIAELGAKLTEALAENAGLKALLREARHLLANCSGWLDSRTDGWGSELSHKIDALLGEENR